MSIVANLRALTKLLGKWANPWLHTGYRKFIVMTRTRTGSNMLVDMMNCHPRVRTRGEKLERLGGRSDWVALLSVFPPQKASVAAAGSKIFYDHPFDDEAGTVWDRLARLDDLYVVHLKRRNVLRTLLSAAIAHSNQQWLMKKPSWRVDPADKRIAIDAAELRSGFEETRRWQEMFAERLSGHPMIDVYYEDVVASPYEECARIFSFLGLPPHPVKTRLLRQNPESLRELLENYAALKKEFAGTEWERHFEE